MADERTPENQTQKLVNRLRENRKSLFIQRVPEKTRRDFIQLAEEEFMGDYGFLLKWLMDDIIDRDTKAIVEALENHEARLTKLEMGQGEPERKPIKMLDGSVKK